MAKVKKLNPDTWLKTPFMQPVKDESGAPTIDAEGNPIEIPLCVTMKQSEAIRLIKKKKRDVAVDAEGNLKAVAEYTVATPDEVKAHLAEAYKGTQRRAVAIKNRQLRNSKAFVMVSPEEMGKATGTVPAKAPEPPPEKPAKPTK